MALINCPECSKEISDSAKICPNCGYEVKKAYSKRKRSSTFIKLKKVLVVILILVAIGGITYGIVSMINKNNELQGTYDDMSKRANQEMVEYQNSKSEIDSLAKGLESIEEGSDDFYKIKNRLKKLIPSIFSNDKFGYTNDIEYLKEKLKLLSDLYEYFKETNSD